MNRADDRQVQIPEHIRITLVATRHPGNIGASARAMKTMGVRQLALVAPSGFPSAEVTARASGADDILARVRVYENLVDATRDCGYVLGTSARMRNIQWPLINPEQAARQILQQALAGTAVAILFGTERTGLSNEDMELCNAVIEIPTDPEFSSLNLAAAVQIICYELRKAAMEQFAVTQAPVSKMPAATVEQMQLFYQQLEQYLRDIGYYHPGKPRLLMRRLKRIFNRIQPDQSEYNILRGIFADAGKAEKEK
ncbi:MAG: RNA methyltransferase [Gammaproteobacteria bacterium]|nr:RNA methyltransferase [Gammaproteobacteria bacterium]